MTCDCDEFQACPKCHTGYLDDGWLARAFEGDFEPCVIHYPEGNYTEMVLSDVATVWCSVGSIDLGYDMETGKLVAIRIDGDVSTKPDHAKR